MLGVKKVIRIVSLRKSFAQNIQFWKKQLQDQLAFVHVTHTGPGIPTALPAC